MTPPARRAALALAGASLLSLACTGCISYTVGMGAETVAPGERASSSSVNLVPGTIGDSVNSTSGTPTRRPSIDSDFRFGLDDRTDLGVRVNTYSGFMLTWKRQLTRADTSARVENRARTAIMLGTGLVNMAEHAAVEATITTSAPWTNAGQFYAAARVTQVVAITGTARRDDPVFGFAFGHLFGDRSNSVGPELGVYYDRSVLGLNSSRILVIPSIVVRREGIPFLGGR